MRTVILFATLITAFTTSSCMYDQHNCATYVKENTLKKPSTDCSN